MRLKTQPAPIVAALGATWCVAVGLWLWFTPVRSVSTTVVAGVRQELTRYRAFSDVSGFGPLPLIVPAGLAILAAWAAWRGSRLGLGLATLLLAGFTFISGFSIGAYYLPAAAALVVATVFVIRR